MSLIVDLFCGGGGTSTGIEMALGRSPDIAINHGEWAVAMHTENHPTTEHYCQNIWEVQPTHVVQSRKVGLLWASPDCTHFSKAKGGKPRDQKIRDLAWTIIKWAEQVQPRIICLENVEEFHDWGPLDENKKPIEELKGTIFKAWLRSLKRAGYRVRYGLLRACDFGAPTTRERFFLVARRDGQPIVWPKPTHGEGLLPHRTAAECIDWDEPACSIFATKEEARVWGNQHGRRSPRRPLAENSLVRIARGVKKFVIDAPNPFVVNGVAPSICKNNNMERITPFLAKYYGGVVGIPATLPVGTVTTIDHHALVYASLSRQFGQSIGCRADVPAPTIMPGGGGKTALSLAFMQKMRGTNIGSELDSPLHTVSAGGQHHAYTVAHLIAYYGSEQKGTDLNKPLRTATTRDRFGLVTVNIAGESYAIVDIAMRMLTPRELYRAQGFPESYIIDYAGGVRLSKEKQVAMVGNSVPPQLTAAIVAANCADMGAGLQETASLPLLEAM